MSDEIAPALEATTVVPAKGPVPEGSRIELWDVLRGVAVLGILLANMPYMSMAGTLGDMEGDHVGGDRWIDWGAFAFVRFVADTKFITTFSLLFGAGLALMGERWAASGRPTRWTYARRLGALLLFGILHGTLLWFGDILASYSLIGFVALAFRKRKTKTLVVWSVVLFTIVLLVFAGFYALDPELFVERRTGPDGQQLSAAESLRLQTAEYAEVFASGDFTRMIGARAEIFLASFAMMTLAFGPRTLAMFLLGFVLVRTGVLKDVAAHRALFRKLFVWGLAIGIPLQIVTVTASLVVLAAEGGVLWREIAAVSLYVGGFTLALGYIGGIALWSLSSAAAALRERLIAVGRMAFSNYIMHSAITAILFNYLGLFDRVRRPEGLLIAFGIFALQLWASPLWLRRFRYGPLEWLWRSITYWERVPFRR